MNDLTGSILIASSLLDETYFENAHVFITEHNEKGAAGFVINKLFERKLNELEEFRSSPPIDIYEGGPVGNEHLYFIHTNVLLGGEKVIDEIYFAGDLHKAVNLLSQGRLSTNEIKIFIGYCGWNEGELEAEINEGSWTITASAVNIFNH